MKYIITLFLILFTISISIKLFDQQSGINYQVIYVDDIEQIDKKVNVCCYQNDTYYLVPVNIDTNDIYNEILNIYNIQRNKLPIGYQVGNYNLFDVEKCVYNDEQLNIIIKNFNGDMEQLKTMLVFTYQYLGILNINLTINDNVFIINDTIPINVKTNCSGFKHIVYLFGEDYILPMTYYHKTNTTDFVLNLFLENKVSYKYDIFENTIFADITDKELIITKQDIDQIYYNLKTLQIYDNIVITKNNVVFYGEL